MVGHGGFHACVDECFNWGDYEFFEFEPGHFLVFHLFVGNRLPQFFTVELLHLFNMSNLISAEKFINFLVKTSVLS